MPRRLFESVPNQAPVLDVLPQQDDGLVYDHASVLLRLENQTANTVSVHIPAQEPCDLGFLHLIDLLLAPGDVRFVAPDDWHEDPAGIVHVQAVAGDGESLGAFVFPLQFRRLVVTVFRLRG